MLYAAYLYTGIARCDKKKRFENDNAPSYLQPSFVFALPPPSRPKGIILHPQRKSGWFLPLVLQQARPPPSPSPFTPEESGQHTSEQQRHRGRPCC